MAWVWDSFARFCLGGVFSDSGDAARQGACLGVSREPRWQGEGVDARRAAPPVVVTTAKPCNAADAPLLANPSGPGRFPLMRRCRLLIGCIPNCVGSALPEGKSAAVAATRNTQTGSKSTGFGARRPGVATGKNAHAMV